MNKNITQLIRKNILALSPYSSARTEHQGNEGIFLDANENPYGSYNRYPDPYQNTLKQRIAKIKKCSPGQIFLGNGSDEVIDITFRIFCEPGRDKALTFSPTYGMYEVAANINGVEMIRLPLDDEFQISTKKLEPYFSDASIRLIFICSPNNPTGNLLRVKDIELILQRFKGIVIIDEAYIDFSAQSSFLYKLMHYPNLIVIQTLSKAWGLAGIRLGMAFMHTELLGYYNKVKAPYNISTANQEKAMEALLDMEGFRENLDRILAERDGLLRELERLKPVKKIYPSDANFILIEVENVTGIYKRLIEQQVVIRNRNSLIKNCVRITVGTPEENRKLITILKGIDNG